VVRAVHRLEHVALDIAPFIMLDSSRRCSLRLPASPCVALDHRRVLALCVVREVAAGAVEIELADVRGEDLEVALLAQLLADEVLQLLATIDRPGVQRISPWPTCVVDVEQPQLLAEDAVVALLRFLELVSGRRRVPSWRRRCRRRG
jgi:hypothetical protein